MSMLADDDMPTMTCPRCKAVLIEHPTRDDGVCGICGDVEVPDAR